MIINKYLIEKIGHYTNPRPVDEKLRDSRREEVLKVLGSKMSLKTWNMFYNLISLKVNPNRKQNTKKYKKINASQAKELLDILGIDYELDVLDVYTYTEKGSTEHKYAVATYAINGELYDSSFRLIKVDNVIKAVPLYECYKYLDEV